LGKDTNESHDPVQRDKPSLLTPRQLTRLSCPARIPTLSPFKTSQTYNINSCSLDKGEAEGGYVAVEIVVSGKEKTTGRREGNGRYPAENGVGLGSATYGDAVYLVIIQLAIRTNIVQFARCIVRTRSKRISIGEVSNPLTTRNKASERSGGGHLLHSINILVMSNKSLDTLCHPNIPHLGHTIARPTHKQIRICRINTQTHHIPQMIRKL
jgi:hypothetical protein